MSDRKMTNFMYEVEEILEELGHEYEIYDEEIEITSIGEGVGIKLQITDDEVYLKKTILFEEYDELVIRLYAYEELIITQEYFRKAFEEEVQIGSGGCLGCPFDELEIYSPGFKRTRDNVIYLINTIEKMYIDKEYKKLFESGCKNCKEEVEEMKNLLKKLQEEEYVEEIAERWRELM